MTGLLERLLDAALVTVTGFVAVAFVMALLAGLVWLAWQAGYRRGYGTGLAGKAPWWEP